jgi:acyl dehydratase
MTPIAFADIPGLAGTTYEGEPFRVSEDERHTFERVTWITRAYPEPDPPEFPESILEGFHSLALLDAAATLARPFDPATTYGFNYGLDRVRFTAPIRIGDLVRSTFEVREVRERGDGYLVLRRCALTVDGADRPALVADWWVLMLPRA